MLSHACEATSAGLGGLGSLGGMAGLGGFPAIGQSQAFRDRGLDYLSYR